MSKGTTRGGHKRDPEQKSKGPSRMVTCVYCHKQVTHRSTVSLTQKEYRICRTHFCTMCHAPLRPENEIRALVNGVDSPVHRSHIYKMRSQAMRQNPAKVYGGKA